MRLLKVLLVVLVGVHFYHLRRLYKVKLIEEDLTGEHPTWGYWGCGRRW